MSTAIITVNGVDYIPATEAGPKPETEIQIVILQRGWVYIGALEKVSDVQFVLHDAQNIRIWGTTRGLGELALEGPQSSTKLDPSGTVRFHPLTVVARLDVDGSKW